MSCNSSHYSVLDSYHKAIAQSFKVIQDMFNKITGIKQSNTFLGFHLIICSKWFSQSTDPNNNMLQNLGEWRKMKISRLI